VTPGSSSIISVRQISAQSSPTPPQKTPFKNSQNPSSPSSIITRTGCSSTRSLKLTSTSSSKVSPPWTLKTLRPSFPQNTMSSLTYSSQKKLMNSRHTNPSTTKLSSKQAQSPLTTRTGPCLHASLKSSRNIWTIT